jgi:hypothetical protein
MMQKTCTVEIDPPTVPTSKKEIINNIENPDIFISKFNISIPAEPILIRHVAKNHLDHINFGTNNRSIR